ncbi:MAG TPA: hypothetical protein VLT33_34100 [Labilithrix sp.]|nr:hypothetical protein [Labilithrix sp.]
MSKNTMSTNLQTDDRSERRTATQVIAAVGMAIALGGCSSEAKEQPAAAETVVQTRDNLTVESRVTADGIWTILTDADSRVLAELEYTRDSGRAVVHFEAGHAATPVDLSKAGAVTLEMANDVLIGAWKNKAAAGGDPTQRLSCWWSTSCDYISPSDTPSLCCWWWC